MVMDELGRMELFSKKFQQKVLEVFDSSVPILAVIQDRRNQFLDAIRGRKDVVIFRVTEENREGLVGEIVGKLESLKVARASSPCPCAGCAWDDNHGQDAHATRLDSCLRRNDTGDLIVTHEVEI